MTPGEKPRACRELRLSSRVSLPELRWPQSAPAYASIGAVDPRVMQLLETIRLPKEP